MKKMFKKLLILVLSLLLIISVMPIGVFNIAASEVKSGTTGDCIWTLDGTTLTISGNGIMKDYHFYSPLAPWGTNITHVVIEAGVTAIGNYAFAECSNLVDIKIPNTVLSIGKGAFVRCMRLTDIEIPDSVESIGDSAFYYCSGFSEITIPESVTSIGERAFMYCINLKNIVIPNNVKILEDYVFAYSGIEAITIPRVVSNIDYLAFMECKNLTTVYFCGSEEEKNDIVIDINGNSCIKNATWYCNSCIGAMEHKYDNNTCSICGNERDTVGDADGNGALDETDNLCLTMILLKSNDYNEMLDMNGDGKIDVIDGILLRKKIGK